MKFIQVSLIDKNTQLPIDFSEKANKKVFFADDALANNKQFELDPASNKEKRQEFIYKKIAKALATNHYNEFPLFIKKLIRINDVANKGNYKVVYLHSKIITDEATIHLLTATETRREAKKNTADSPSDGFLADINNTEQFELTFSNLMEGPTPPEFDATKNANAFSELESREALILKSQEEQSKQFIKGRIIIPFTVVPEPDAKKAVKSSDFNEAASFFQFDKLNHFMGMLTRLHECNDIKESAEQALNAVMRQYSQDPVMRDYVAKEKANLNVENIPYDEFIKRIDTPAEEITTLFHLLKNDLTERYAACLNTKAYLDYAKEYLAWTLYFALSFYYGQLQAETINQDRTTRVKHFNEHFKDLVQIRDGALTDISVVYNHICNLSLDKINTFLNKLLGAECNTTWFINSDKQNTLVEKIKQAAAVFSANRAQAVLRFQNTAFTAWPKNLNPLSAGRAITAGFAWDEALLNREKELDKVKDTVIKTLTGDPKFQKLGLISIVVERNLINALPVQIKRMQERASLYNQLQQLCTPINDLVLAIQTKKNKILADYTELESLSTSLPNRQELITIESNNIKRNKAAFRSYINECTLKVEEQEKAIQEQLEELIALQQITDQQTYEKRFSISQKKITEISSLESAKNLNQAFEMLHSSVSEAKTNALTQKKQYELQNLQNEIANAIQNIPNLDKLIKEKAKQRIDPDVNPELWACVNAFADARATLGKLKKNWDKKDQQTINLFKEIDAAHQVVRVANDTLTLHYTICSLLLIPHEIKNNFNIQQGEFDSLHSKTDNRCAIEGAREAYQEAKLNIEQSLTLLYQQFLKTKQIEITLAENIKNSFEKLREAYLQLQEIKESLERATKNDIVQMETPLIPTERLPSDDPPLIVDKRDEVAKQQKSPSFLKLHWGKMLLGGLTGMALVFTGLLTSGVLPLIFTHLSLAYLFVSGSITLGGALGVGMGAGVGKYVGREPEGGAVGFLSRNWDKILLGTTIALGITGLAIAGLFTFGAAPLAFSAIGVATAGSLSGLGISVSTTTAGVIGSVFIGTTVTFLGTVAAGIKSFFNDTRSFFSNFIANKFKKRSVIAGPVEPPTAPEPPNPPANTLGKTVQPSNPAGNQPPSVTPNVGMNHVQILQALSPEAKTSTPEEQDAALPDLKFLDELEQFLDDWKLSESKCTLLAAPSLEKAPADDLRDIESVGLPRLAPS